MDHLAADAELVVAARECSHESLEELVARLRSYLGSAPSGRWCD